LSAVAKVTLMSDEPFYAPFRKPPPPREPKPGERLWTLHKDGDTQSAELRDYGDLGCGLQLLLNDQWHYGRRQVLRAFALEEAAGHRRQPEADGWRE
jgi:hypothetical protein